MSIGCFFKRALCLLLIPVILLPFFEITVYAENATARGFDFSYAESDLSVTLAPSELLSLLYPSETVSEAEKSYVDAYFGSALIYTEYARSSDIRVEVSGDTLTVTAVEKSYTAANGATVTWRPVGCTYAAQYGELIKTADGYTCTLTLTDSELVTVEYTCSLELSADDVYALANFAYGELELSKQAQAENSTALNGYLSEVTAYKEYLDKLTQYENELDSYNEYLEKKRIYDERLEEYNAYLAAMAKYQAELDAYNKYLTEYAEYLDKKEKYEKAYAENKEQIDEYRKYLAGLQKIRSSMYAIEAMFVTPTNGVRALFDALQNDELVAMIEKHQGKLVTYYGVEKSDITEMRAASDRLNELLIAYSDARDTSEEAAFAYYKANYAEISESFSYLYEKLLTIITPTIYTHVCALVDLEYRSDPEFAEYRKWRIKNILCHIYLIARCLDDSVSADDTWSFYLEDGSAHVYNFADLLSQNVIISDSNCACPDGLEWQSFDIPDGGLPEIPVKPTELQKPAVPATVAKPTAPAVVTAPSARPTEVTAPVQPVIENYELIQRITDSGLEALSERALPESLSISLTSRVSRPFSSSGAALQAYFSYDGSLIKTGTEPEQPPIRPSTAQYGYTFSGWLSTTSYGDTLAYPTYTHTLREYTVTFKYSASDTEPLCELTCAYGELPVCNTVPYKAPTETETYSFGGWYPAVKPTSGDVTYVAQFTSSERKYTVSWDRGVFGEITRECSYAEEPTFPTVRDVQYKGGTKYIFTGWDKPQAPITSDTTYTALFDTVQLVSLDAESTEALSTYETDAAYVVTTNATHVDISALLSHASDDGREIIFVSEHFTLRLTSTAVASLNRSQTVYLNILGSDSGTGYKFTSASGTTVRPNGNIYMTLAHTFNSSDNVFILSSLDNRYFSELSCTLGNGQATFEASPSRLYTVQRYYTLTLEHNEGGAVFADRVLYKAGDSIELTVMPNAEFIVSSVAVTYASGDTETPNSLKGLSMPQCDMTVTVEFAVKKYAISFVVDGNVIATEHYALGETIAPPELELTFEKDGFLYTFIGWSEQPSVVTGDATFTAKYYCVRLELLDGEEAPSAIKTVITKQLIPIFCVLALIAAATASAIVLLVKYQKKKKRTAHGDGKGENGNG